MNVYFDTSPLQSGHAVRGIGVYTKLLAAELAQFPDVTLLNETQHSEAEITHYPYFDLFYPTLPLAFGASKRVVTIHDVIPLLFPEHYPVGIRGKLAHFRQKVALSSIDAVITDSDSSKADIIKHLGVPEEKVHRVYLAAPPDIIHQPLSKQATVRKELSLPEQFILYVGDINYNKNIPGLIRALQYMKASTHLVCVGKNFTPQPIPEWQAISEVLPSVAERVHFLNEVGKDDQNQLAALYSAANVYVQPSFYEGFGLPVLEALQVGTPVVCSHNSSLSEVGGNVVEYCTTDPAGIAQAVNTVLQLKETALHHRIAAGKEWSAQFSWYKTAQQTVRIYEQVLNLS